MKQTLTIGAYLFCAVVAAAERTATADREVIARVDGEPIFRAEVAPLVAQMGLSTQSTTYQDKTAKSRALEHLVNRRLVVRYLDRKGLAASRQDVDVSIDRLKKQLSQANVTLGDYARDQGLSVEAVRQKLRWDMSWGRFLKEYLTQDRIRQHFQRHRREYDGTELQVSHILLKSSDAGATDSRVVNEQIELADEIRADIMAGKLSFTQAAGRFSKSPTAESGGGLGWISRQGPMPEAFSSAAFRLQEGEVSAPVVTTIGVHLIRCTGERPGQRSWEDVQGRLRKDLAGQAFERIARLGRASAKIDYTVEPMSGTP